MKTIIVATDYSPAANNALEYAANLASIVKADLVLFNTYHLSGHASNALVGPKEIEKMVEQNQLHLHQLATETAEKYKIQVDWTCKLDDTVEELDKYATTSHADLVVMGMESNLIEYELFGNTTTAVIRRLKVPVLVVPNEVLFTGIEKILYAYDPACLDQDNHLDLMKEFAKQFDAKLQVLHVETKVKEGIPVAMEDGVSSEIDNLLEEIAHTYSAISSRQVGEGIAKGVEAFDADLLVMVTHKSGFLESLIKGSTTRKVVLKTRVPLLVLPNPNLN